MVRDASIVDAAHLNGPNRQEPCGIQLPRYVIYFVVLITTSIMECKG